MDEERGQPGTADLTAMTDEALSDFGVEESHAQRPSARGHARLLQLREQFRISAMTLQDASSGYYYLCDVIAGKAEPPTIFVELHSNCFSDGQPLRWQVERGPTEETRNMLMTQLLGHAAVAYASAWERILSIAVEAVEVCQELAGQGQVTESP